MLTPYVSAPADRLSAALKLSAAYQHMSTYKIKRKTMNKVAERPQISDHHHQEIQPFAVILPHDTSKEIWDDLHLCYSVVNLARTALAYHDGGKDSPSFSSSVALEMVATKLMNAIQKLDDLSFAR